MRAGAQRRAERAERVKATRLPVRLFQEPRGGNDRGQTDVERGYWQGLPDVAVQV
jgi:hypothetical protein